MEELEVIKQGDKFVIIIQRKNQVISYNERRVFGTEIEANRHLKYLKKREEQKKHIKEFKNGINN